MSTIRCDGCGEYREWDGYTLVKGCSCLGKIGEPTVYDELNELKSDLRKLRKGLSLIIDNQGCTCSYRYTCTRCSLDIWKDDFDKLLDGK